MPRKCNHREIQSFSPELLSHLQTSSAPVFSLLAALSVHACFPDRDSHDESLHALVALSHKQRVPGIDPDWHTFHPNDVRAVQVGGVKVQLDFFASHLQLPLVTAARLHFRLVVLTAHVITLESLSARSWSAAVVVVVVVAVVVVVVVVTICAAARLSASGQQ